MHHSIFFLTKMFFNLLLFPVWNTIRNWGGVSFSTQPFVHCHIATISFRWLGYFLSRIRRKISHILLVCCFFRFLYQFDNAYFCPVLLRLRFRLELGTWARNVSCIPADYCGWYDKILDGPFASNISGDYYYYLWATGEFDSQGVSYWLIKC